MHHQEQLTSLLKATRPASEIDAIELLEILFAQFPSGIHENQSARLRGYLLAISDIPLSCIQLAVNDFISGRVKSHDGRFMPTCAQFAKHARSKIVDESKSIRHHKEMLHFLEWKIGMRDDPLQVSGNASRPNTQSIGDLSSAKILGFRPNGKRDTEAKCTTQHKNHTAKETAE